MRKQEKYVMQRTNESTKLPNAIFQLFPKLLRLHGAQHSNSTIMDSGKVLELNEFISSYQPMQNL